MALERKIIKDLPATFNPSNQRQIEAIRQQIVIAQFGPGWEVESYDPDLNQLTFTRGSAVTTVRSSGKRAGRRFKEVSVGSDARMSDGEKHAQKLEADPSNAGFFLTQYLPHIGIARLTEMNADERRCREAVSNALGVPRWDVQVYGREDGGFDLELPPRYDPVKHFPKLEEIAEGVVGRPGWYVELDPKSLRGSIIPAEQPTFAPVYPVDFRSFPPVSRVTEKERWQIPLGVGLGRNGQPNRPVNIDFYDAVGALLVGLAGSGKSVATQEIVFSALSKGWQLALINTVDKAGDFTWAKKYVAEGMWGCDSVAQSVTVAKRLAEEGERRGRLLAEYGVSKLQELPESVQRENPPMLVIADELAALLTSDPLPKGLNSEMKSLPEFVQMQQDILESNLLGTALTRLPAVYRAAGIRVIYLTQQPNERFGFSTKLKGNLPHRIMLGVNPSQAEKGHAFRTAEKVPDVPANIAQDSTLARGVGLAHLDGQEACVFKGYYSSLEDYIRECERRGFPTSISPEPSPSEIRRLVPSIGGEEEGFGRGPREYEAWELDQDGIPLSGFERANAARHQATVGARSAEANG